MRCASCRALLKMEEDRDLASPLVPRLDTPSLLESGHYFFTLTASANSHVINHREWWGILSNSRAAKRLLLRLSSEGCHTWSLLSIRHLAAVLEIFFKPQRFESVKSRNVCFSGNTALLKPLF